MTTPQTGCECSEPGWCERHQCTKHARWFKLCQTRADYFDLWERGAGPGQYTAGGSPPKPKRLGVGGHLHAMLNRVGIDAKPDCPCRGHAAQMDAWGPAKCRERMDTILGWLKKEALRRRLPYVQFVAKRLVLMAIRRAEKEMEREPV